MLQSNFQFPGQTDFYKGKVRDVYSINERQLVMIVSDRISAFDVVLPKPIPYKGQVLNQIAAIMLEATKDIVPNWVEHVPLPNVTIGKKCEPFPVEMVIRGNLTGHAWRVYKSGERTICGIRMPDNMRENDFFTDPIITPTTKAHEGHDEDISREEIIAQGLVNEEDYDKLELYTRQLFDRGKELAENQGLLLVDTKYEFGKIGDEIYLIDEVHTPDSSRYFYMDTYEANQEAGVAQHQLSKEFVREWLMSNGFQGQTGQAVPEMSDDFILSVSERYIELYEKIIGDQFKKREVTNEMIQDVVVKTLEKY